MSETIINGIDVSECEFLRKCVIPDNEGCAVDDSLCCDVGNCYFKQLKRLQEENEGLKSLNDFNVQKIEVLQEENEKQKEQLNIYMSQYEIKIPNKYRQTLEEIRSNCNNYAKTENYVIDDTFNEFLEIIFDKINEVLDDRD